MWNSLYNSVRIIEPHFCKQPCINWIVWQKHLQNDICDVPLGKRVIFKTFDVKVQVQNVPELWRQMFWKVLLFLWNVTFTNEWRSIEKIHAPRHWLQSSGTWELTSVWKHSYSRFKDLSTTVDIEEAICLTSKEVVRSRLDCLRKMCMHLNFDVNRFEKYSFSYGTSHIFFPVKMSK